MTEIKKSKAEIRKTLFKKSKGIIGSYYNTADFKEPIAIVMRRNQKATFHENVTQGEFEIEHSDGTDRTILMNTKYLQSFPYGSKTFKGYICHEDFPLPLPCEPDVTADTVGIVIDKTLNDIRKWNASEITAKGQMYWKIAMGIAVLIGMYILFKILVPSAPTPSVETVKTVGETTVQVLNATVIR